MNHIDEGMWILKQIGASDFALRAFALHPLLQDDAALLEFTKPSTTSTNPSETSSAIESVDKYVLLLAMEYRWVANSYLSFHPSRPITEIKLSPIAEVNQLLIADKVQNRKDFEMYHYGTHPQSERLKQYFGEWLERLGVSEAQYQQWVGEIKLATGQGEHAWPQTKK